MATSRQVTTFEVYVLQRGRWELHARHASDNKDGAVNEAMTLDKLPSVDAVKVVREVFDSSEGSSREYVVYKSANLKTTDGAGNRAAPRPQGQASGMTSGMTSGMAPGMAGVSRPRTPAAPRRALPPGNAPGAPSSRSTSKPLTKAGGAAQGPAKDDGATKDGSGAGQPAPSSTLGVLTKLLLLTLFSVFFAALVTGLSSMLLKGREVMGVHLSGHAHENLLFGTFVGVFLITAVPMAIKFLSAENLASRQRQSARREAEAARTSGAAASRPRTHAVPPPPRLPGQAPATGPSAASTMRGPVMAPPAGPGAPQSDGASPDAETTPDAGPAGDQTGTPAADPALGPAQGPVQGPVQGPAQGPPQAPPRPLRPGDGAAGAPQALSPEAAPPPPAVHRDRSPDQRRRLPAAAAGPAPAPADAAEDEAPLPDSAPPLTPEAAAHAEMQRKTMMQFLGRALEAVRDQQQTLDGSQKFGINLFLAGACEKLSKEKELDRGSTTRLLAEGVQVMGFPPDQAGTFAAGYERYLMTDPRYLRMYESGRSAMGANLDGDPDGAGRLDQALVEWDTPTATEGGPITVLFTDLAGSTRMTQTLGDAGAQAVVRAHNRIVRDALAAHGGREIKHTGDGIMASFARTSDGAEAAIAIQRGARADAEANPDRPVRIKIGINAGEPIAEENDLFGTTVQLAARIVDKAEQGQILVSDVVRGICVGKDLTFANRGAYEFKGFPEPMLVYELMWT